MSQSEINFIIFSALAGQMLGSLFLAWKLGDLYATVARVRARRQTSRQTRPPSAEKPRD
jgi:TRAP-type C4-dicarboxylate transport system permease large subunit